MRTTRLQGRLLLRVVKNGRLSQRGRVPSNMVLTVNTKGGETKLWVTRNMLMLIRSRSHIFDGKDLTKETAAFQLCDIEDPMLMEMINDPNNMQEECNVSSNFPLGARAKHSVAVQKERDGWYTTQAYDRIKMVLRHKFFSLLEGHVATDEEYRNLLAANEGSVKMSATRSQRLRAGKHNMAKGALRPEDAAVCFSGSYQGFFFSDLV